jgi:hypothetical protein
MKKSKKNFGLLGPCLIIICFIVLIWWSIYYLYKNNFFQSKRDLFQNMKTNYLNPHSYPSSVLNPLLSDSYPLKEKKGVSNDNYPQIWFNYPVLPLGSFKQVTNNLRYRYNPDNGQCITADFCGAIYKDKKNKSNIVKMLPPVQSGYGARVNYYRNKENLLLQSC